MLRAHLEFPLFWRFHCPWSRLKKAWRKNPRMMIWQVQARFFPAQPSLSLMLRGTLCQEATERPGKGAAPRAKAGPHNRRDRARMRRCEVALAHLVALAGICVAVP